MRDHIEENTLGNRIYGAIYHGTQAVHLIVTHFLERVNVTPLLKALLHSYGLLYVTVITLQKERPGNSTDSLQEYYKSLGKAEPGEPVLAVRISKDGETRFIHQASDQLPTRLREEYGEGDVTVMELPEDEFYFFQAFRPGLFDLNKELPEFMLQMALVHAYTLFENYITDIVRMRLQAHPEQVGLKKQFTVGELLSSASREDLLAKVVEKEVQQIMHLPLTDIVKALRSRFGFRTLSRRYDHGLQRLSLVRNCLIHNAARVDRKLAALDARLQTGAPLEVGVDVLIEAINICRKFCSATDQLLESLDRP